GLFANPLVAGHFEQFLMSWLLLGQPHNYSDALRGRFRPVAPRHARRVADYMLANLAESISLTDLVRVAGTPARTLLKQFRDSYGPSPRRSLRRLRMQRVRDELAGGPAARVGEAARRWRFEHPGRFSVEYRRRFGESPSITLGRARPAAVPAV